VPRYRAMVVFENVTGLPEDRFINTWHFSSSLDHAQAGQTLGLTLESFYTGPGPNSVAAFLSPHIDHGAGKTHVRVYDLADAEPREPEIFVWPGSLPAGSGAALPNEVAVVMSFFSDRNLRRQRGRLYFGPLRVEASTSGTGDQRVSTQFVGAIQNGLSELNDSGAAAVWSIYSRMDDMLRPVTNVWVDNALDTQRRRGRRPETRTEFDFSAVP
jgi:hypothetical protein